MMMRYLILISFLMLGVLLRAQTRYDVSSSSEFSAAQQQAIAGDSIVWQSGIYKNTRMDIDKDGLIITAETYGTVLFTGVSRVVINGDNITFSGFQYIGGFIGNLDVIRVFGSDILITQVNIQNYTSYKYLVVDEDSRRTTISYCNFENRLNLDDKNILSILVDNEPGYHKVQYCSFKHFDGFGADQGIEPIRIGVSTQGELDSRTLVEYCYFTQCNGDGEIISHKSRQNVYRYNTFQDNPYSELVLRHGDEGIVYGNFFLNNRGGVRIREGSNHFIFNNYFEDIESRAIWLMNDPVDPLSEIHIYHNTVVNSAPVRLGGSENNPPSNVTIANNVLTNSIDPLFIENTGNETWINNLSFGDIGIDTKSTGLTEDIDLQLLHNTEGFVQPGPNSPAIAGATADYPAVPLYPGMDYDNEILLDLMKVARPLTITERAIGASEFSSTTLVQPHVTEMNTGPSYLFDNLVNYVTANASQIYNGGQGETRAVKISSNIDWTVTSNEDWITTNFSAASGDDQLVITIDPNKETTSRSGTITITGDKQTVTITVFQDGGEPVSVLDELESNVLLFPNPTDSKIRLSNLPEGNYNSLVEIIDLEGRTLTSREYPIDNSDLILDVNELVPGTYLLNVRLMSPDGSLDAEFSRRFMRK